MYFSRSVDLARRCSISSATCCSIVATRQGSSPRMPSASRSGWVNAASLLSSGCSRMSTPLTLAGGAMLAPVLVFIRASLLTA